MKLARSSSYYQPESENNQLLRAQADLRDRIEAICLEFPGYGYRRVTRQLKRDHRIVNHKKVLRIMRESDLLCRMKRKKVKTTDSKHHFPPLSQSDQEQSDFPAESSLAGGYYLYPDSHGLCLPGGHPGCLFPEGDRLCRFKRSGDGPDIGSSKDGHIS